MRELDGEVKREVDRDREREKERKRDSYIEITID